MADEQEVSTEVAEVQETVEETPAETEEKETTETTEEVAAGEEAPAAAVPPKKKTAQERIDEITKARRDAEREREYWKKVALEKEPGTPKQEPAPSETEAIGPPRPKIAAYESTEVYEDALLKWHDDRRAIQTQRERQATEQKAALDKFNAAAAKVRAEHDDFDEVLEAPVFSQDMRIILLNSENGPSVAYHLGRPENRDLVDRIRAMPPNMQVYELGKLEVQLSLAQKTKKTPSAPAPLKPVGSGGGATIDESKLTDDEWYALEKKRTIEALERKYKPGG